MLLRAVALALERAVALALLLLSVLIGSTVDLQA